LKSICSKKNPRTPQQASSVKQQLLYAIPSVLTW